MALDLGLHLGLGMGVAGEAEEVPVALGALAFYDPSDLSTMWKDTAGTDPVTADGDAVARIDDKSGNGLNLTQGTAANRPLYKTSGGLHWLQFDGTNDQLSLNSAALRLLGDMTIVAGVYKNAGGSFAGIATCQTLTTGFIPYEFRFSNHAATLQPQFVSSNNAGPETDIADTTAIGSFATACVASLRRDVGVDVEFGINQAREVEAHLEVPTADANSTFMIGARYDNGTPSTFLAGRIYQLVINDTRLGDTDLDTLEEFVADKCGVTL